MLRAIRSRSFRGRANRKAPAAGLLALFLLLLANPVMARRGEPPPSFDPGFSKSLRAAGAVDLVVLPAVDEALFLREDAGREAAEDPGPLRFAAPVDAGYRCAPGAAGSEGGDGSWERLPEGARLWRLRVVSPGARSLNFGLTGVRLPRGARLYLYPAASANDLATPPELREYQGPFDADDVGEDAELWTPIVSGDDAVLELHVPAGAGIEPALTVRRVNHDYRGFSTLQGTEKDQGTCNVDVVCSQGDPWRKEIRAVAVYTLSGNWTCTGTLINSHDAQRPPLFLTANHCSITQQNAGSMVVYWNFESPSCGMLSGGSLSDNQTGASLLAKWADSDFCLVRLNQTPAAGSRVYYAGWDAREETSPPWAVCIHHPDCQEKAISFTNRPLSITSYLSNPSPGNGTHWRVLQWDEGTTEPGSSGSGLWDPDHRLVGQLHGGRASCSQLTESDWYGRMSRSWEGGGANDSRLRNWLDPQATGVKFLDGHDPFGGGPLAGDANVDGVVNVLDLSAIVSDILGTQALTTQGRTNADLDLNGRISVTDLVRVVNLILNPDGPLAAEGAGGLQGGATPPSIPATGESRPQTEPIRLAARLGESGSNQSLVLFGEAGSAAAVEFTLQTGHRASAPRYLAVSAADPDWRAAAALLPDGELRVVGYSALRPGAGSAQTLRLSIELPADAGRIEWSGGGAADPQGTALTLQASGFPLEASGSAFEAVEMTVLPNPTRGAWEVELTLPAAGEVNLEVYDAAGRAVAAQARSDVRAGRNRVRWVAGGNDGSGDLPPGLYFVRARQGDRRIGDRKLLVVR